MLVHWIWLATRQGLSKRTQYELIRCFEDPLRVYRASAEALKTVPGVTSKALEALEDKSLEQAAKILSQCEKKNIQILTLDDPGYPRRLRGIYDPPIVLYYLGSLPDWESKPMVGAVGTRRCSDYGIRSGEKFGYELVCCGAAVVSGMAEGVDTAILKGALSAEGSPVVFLAGGVDVVYPVENSDLYQKLLTRGCVLSEYPPESKPMKWNFPVRNRLISGISDAVLVVEAPEKSGALITACHAMKQGREVYVVPSPIDVLSGQGSNSLLKDGAHMAQCAWDILEHHQASYGGVSNCCRSFEKYQKVPQKPPKEKKVIDNSGKPPYIDVEKKPAARSPQEQRIIDQLLSGPRLTDEVINACGLSKGEALAVMTMLEIRGVLSRLPGNLVALNET